MMRDDIKQDWLFALRSGRYPETYKTLKDKKGCFCALGVLADTFGDATWTLSVSHDSYTINFKGEWGIGNIPRVMQQEAGLTLHQCDKIIVMTFEGKSHLEIADWIEANL